MGIRHRYTKAMQELPLTAFWQILFHNPGLCHDVLDFPILFIIIIGLKVVVFFCILKLYYK